MMKDRNEKREEEEGEKETHKKGIGDWNRVYYVVEVD